MLIAIPTTGEIRRSLVERLLDFDKRDDVEIYFSEESPVDANRCKITKYFLEETDHERLLMIDDDIIPPENILELAEHDKDIITPVLFSTRDDIPYPVITDRDEDSGELKMALPPTDRSLFEVDAAGTGCLMIHRRVFEGMDEPYFEFVKDDDGTINTGEDFNFCLTAKENGFEVWCHLDYVCGHVVKTNLRSFMEHLHNALDENKSEIFVEEVG